MKQIIINIERCEDCPYIIHTRLFTKGGEAKPDCVHPKIKKKKGRIIPSNSFWKDGLFYSKISIKIPKWCPLPDKRKFKLIFPPKDYGKIAAEILADDYEASEGDIY